MTTGCCFFSIPYKHVYIYIYIYNGTCEKNFKERYNNHTASFRNENKEKSTEHSKYN